VKDGLAARRFVVSGKVQGVFFRASTARAAEQLRLRGHAHNLPDGRVEVLAVGSAASLESLARWLWQGPPLAQVSEVVAEELAVAPYAGLTDFRTG
jgi:acylphosphatase